MHIGIVLSSLGAGGAERVVALVSRHWADQGHQVTIFAFDRPDDLCFHDLDPRVRTVRLGIGNAGGRKRATPMVLRRIRQLRSAFTAHRPDAIVSFLFKINVLTLIASRGLGIPVAVSERNHPVLQPAHPAWRRLVSWTYPWADLIVLQTEASRASMDPSIRSRCVVIGNPIGHFPRSAEPEGRKILAAVGRLERQKGFDLLIDAFALVERRHPDWVLKIWGDGPLRAQLDDRIRSEGLEGRVVLAGLSKGPADWIAQSSAYVVTSEYEGFCNALAEAGMAGLPRVATLFEFGAREQIENEVDGLLVAERDPRTLAEALDRLMSDPELRKRLGTRAADSGKRFAPERILVSWDHLLTLLRQDS